MCHMVRPITLFPIAIIENGDNSRKRPEDIARDLLLASKVDY